MPWPRNMNNKASCLLSQLAEHTKTKRLGDDVAIAGVGSITDAQPGQITFLNDSKYYHALDTTQASAVILHGDYGDDTSLPRLISDNPLLTFAQVAGFFYPAPTAAAGIHPRACVAEDCDIAADASIAAGCVIEPGVRIAEQCVIGANCVIAENCAIGARSRIDANVVIKAQAQLGCDVHIHSGAIVGSDGFGFAQAGASWVRVPQCGSVRIGNAVEIGVNTVIDRGAIGDTVIEEGVKINHLVEIAHNVHVGAHTVIAGCSGVAGSTRIGSHCLIGGGVCITGHISICDRAVIAGMSRVSSSIKQADQYNSGVPLQSYQQWRRNIVHIRRLNQMHKRIKQLEQARE